MSPVPGPVAWGAGMLTMTLVAMMFLSWFKRRRKSKT